MIARVAALGLLLLLLFGPLGDAKPASRPTRTTYSVEYSVTISRRDPTVARIRWKLAGIDEVAYIRFDLGRSRFYDFSGTGTLEEKDRGLVWRPASPYAHLEYKVDLKHRRSTGTGFDSYADDGWVITRAKSLFPRARVSIDRTIEPNPSPRCSIVFNLPDGWEAYTAMEEMAPRTFQPDHSNRLLDRPTGWFALGRLDVARRMVDGFELTIAKSHRSKLASTDYLDLYEKSVPILTKILDRKPPRLLIVSGPDPMWRGGISGKNSYYVHGDRPVRTPDRTSPALHELFHVMAPFRPGEDGTWVTEGLPEYYSLELQRRVGAIKQRDFERGLRLFERYGEWKVNLTARSDLAATNNSAPLLMYVIDRAIRERTKGEHSLDDVVRRLAEQKRNVSTADFLRAVNSVSSHNFTPFFQRHVYAGIPPNLEHLEISLPGKTNRRHPTPERTGSAS